MSKLIEALRLSQIFSRDGLMGFHICLTPKGRMNANTVAARNAGANMMLILASRICLGRLPCNHLRQSHQNYQPSPLAGYVVCMQTALVALLRRMMGLVLRVLFLKVGPCRHQPPLICHLRYQPKMTVLSREGRGWVER